MAFLHAPTEGLENLLNVAEWEQEQAPFKMALKRIEFQMMKKEHVYFQPGSNFLNYIGQKQMFKIRGVRCQKWMGHVFRIKFSFQPFLVY
jgi:hypothetical protein